MRKGTVTVQTQSQHNHHQHASARPHHLHTTTTTTTTTTTSTSTAPSPNSIRVLHHQVSIGLNDTHVKREDDGPPKKKRRLSIKTPTRTTPNHKPLEAFGFSRTPQPKPPTKITRDEPHGPLQQTTNGVKSVLDVNEDEILPPPRSAERVPKRATRSPSPAPLPPTPSTPAPAQEKKKEDKRTLRSQDDGPRLKSELAVYFPNYEDVMFDVPAEEEDFLTVDSTLYIADDTAKKKDGTPSPVKSKKASTPGRKACTNGIPATPKRTTSSMSNASPSVNLDFLAKTSGETPEDPLTDAHFLKSHNRAERKEKQLRNIERERAMHEKLQLERLLDGLQGHDWLRVLGITGITDGEATKYKSKRKYFIAEVQALIGKFAQWKEQEKKLRLRKEAAQARQDTTDLEASSIASDPPSSDLNASASRQLQQETVNAVKASASKSKGKLSLYGPSATSHPLTPVPLRGPARGFLQPIPHSPEAPITSFYAKRHLRDAALSKSRSATRNVTAFGHPVPDLDEQEFALPEDFVTPDALRANARERRRRKRESTAAK